ncbi:hypothetical protein LI034_06555 [Clostridium perfringens]|uniref:hypothetical protein n=1 Tax=Clostridium perfringens TaxID=1502 RepID=UPI0010402A70|nr:hypothetical protein [Clostridium perfringens]MCX0360656.1 hypothetical protein [Clostridium perfringens]TBX10611.1 hypothetical protein BFS04_02770 [Clostridium perfringens]HAT4352904.1 hypothetical protein [Clostridium perfringens]
MENKISLVYENGEFTVYINDEVVTVNKYMDNAIEKFTQTVHNNATPKSIKWESIEEDLKGIDLKDLEINSEFKTLTYKDMKYFYSTDKIFNMHGGRMQQLLGGYQLFSFIVKMISEKHLEDYLEVLNFCEDILRCKVTYRTPGSNFIVGSPAFNYGSASYDFATGKVNKGALIEKMSFEDFKKYIFDIIK